MSLNKPNKMKDASGIIVIVIKECTRRLEFSSKTRLWVRVLKQTRFFSV